MPSTSHIHEVGVVGVEAPAEVGVEVPAEVGVVGVEAPAVDVDRLRL